MRTRVRFHKKFVQNESEAGSLWASVSSGDTQKRNFHQLLTRFDIYAWMELDIDAKVRSQGYFTSTSSNFNKNYTDLKGHYGIKELATKGSV